MKKYLPIVLPSIAIFALFFLLFQSAQISKAATATHVVISEIQIEGGTTTDEFVELYNPTDSTVDVTGWELIRKTAAADAEEQPLATLSGTISSHGFMLIANVGYDGTTPADTTYDTEFNITDNNSITLRNESGTNIDLVGMGSSALKEGDVIDNPIDNRSIERKAIGTSTTESMISEGVDELLGNGEDTDNNAVDFVRHSSPTISNPQNSSSNVEPGIIPTPTNEPEPTDVPSPTVTNAPTPTNEPTPTTQEPSPTIEVSPTISPTPTTKPRIAVPNLQIVCTDRIINFNIFGVSHNFTFPSCKLVRVN